MNLRKLMLTAACGLVLVSGSAAAANTEALKVGLAGDHTDALPTMRGSRLVVFRYSDQVSFAIRAMEGTYVNIEVPEGEVIQGVYLSDAMQWEARLTADKKRVMVKPLAPGLVNTGTLVTNKRSYELTMLSVPPGQMWFQRVRWQVPSDNALSDGFWSGQSKPADSGSVDLAALDPATLHFDYRVRGREKFAPVTVFDDGTRTWLRFDDIQDLPAIFADNGNGLEVVEYSAQGGYVVIPSVNEELILRLRDDEVRVDRR